MLLFFVSVGVALGLSAICSLLEATLLSYSSSQVAALETKRPLAGRIWRRFKDNIEKPIAAILVVNTAAHTVGATMAGAQFEKAFGPQGLVAFSILFTWLMLQFTEVLPKTLGVRYNALLAPVVAPPLQASIRLLGPLLWLIQLMNRPFSGSRNEREDTTLQEIAALAASARMIDPQHARMIQAASELESINVRQIMTPRTEMRFLLSKQPIEDILDIIKRSPYTRLPLCEDSVDDVVGMVHIKDLMRMLDLKPGHFGLDSLPQAEHTGPEKVTASSGSRIHVFGTGVIDLMKIKREILFLPERINILQALRQFQKARVHMAIIVDEYGSTMGLVTLEDVLEEMVGDIRDEFDPFSVEPIRKDGEQFRVSGRCPLRELLLAIPDLHIKALAEDIDTVGGYVSLILRHLPRVGEGFRDGHHEWTVSSVDERRVKEVIISRVEQAASSRNSESSSTGHRGIEPSRLE